MESKRKREPDDKEQSARFVETARQLGADEDSRKFDKTFKKIVKPKAVRPGPSGKRA